mmetsp:Transcript_48605/g.128412  ORF Transcript_48605/g.128412 Transcript_48605/m.128412 type:complete len:245 (-) Transcript_48605:101-835(-)
MQLVLDPRQVLLETAGVGLRPGQLVGRLPQRVGVVLRRLPHGLLQTVDGDGVLAAQLLHQSLVGGCDIGHLGRVRGLQVLDLPLLLRAQVVDSLLVALAQRLAQLRQGRGLPLGEVGHDPLVVGRQLRHQLLALLARLVEPPVKLGPQSLELRGRRAPHGVGAVGDLGEALLQVFDLGRVRLSEARELGAQGLQLLLARRVLGFERRGHLAAQRLIVCLQLKAVILHDAARVAFQLLAHPGQLV